MDSEAGAPGVRVSKEMQQLNAADNFAQVNQGKSRMNFADKKGDVSNLVQQVKNIQGRAVYNNGNFWVDSGLQRLKSQDVQRIQFASDEYFKLLKEEPLSAEFLALGQNVRFVLNNQVYEVYEK